MRGFELILLLLAICAVLRLIADRITVPYLSLLVVMGIVLAVVPGLPRLNLRPDVLFVIFVPPLLYWGAASFPLRDLRRELGAIARLAVLLVLVSTAAVAVTIHQLNPTFTWAAAITLGAIVAPPDAIAVLSALSALRLSRPVQSILEGESLVNDAAALITYRLAVFAAVTGSFSAFRAALGFVSGAAGGVVIGILIGALTIRLLRYAGAVAAAAGTVSLLTPFAAFLLAQRVGVSGVLAVVSAGMYVARAEPRFMGSQVRLQLEAMWSVVTFMLESLIFIFVGLELRDVTRALDRAPISFLVKEVAVVCLCLVLVRFVFVIGGAYVLRRIGRWLRGTHEPLPGWRQVMFIGWAGLRGADSLVLALALPLVIATGAPFPARDEIVFITFCVIVITLVLQGPTLAPLARRAGLGRGREDESEEAHARLTAAEAGLEKLGAPEVANSARPEVVRYLRRRQIQRARRWAERERHVPSAAAPGLVHDHVTAAPSHEAGVLDETRAAEYRRVRSAMIDAEQRALLNLRDSGAIGDDIMRRVQRDLDLELVMLQSREPVSESMSELPGALEKQVETDDAAGRP